MAETNLTDEYWGTLMDIQNIADELLKPAITLRQFVEDPEHETWTPEKKEALDNLIYMFEHSIPAVDIDKLKALKEQLEEEVPDET